MLDNGTHCLYISGGARRTRNDGYIPVYAPKVVSSSPKRGPTGGQRGEVCPDAAPHSVNGRGLVTRRPQLRESRSIILRTPRQLIPLPDSTIATVVLRPCGAGRRARLVVTAA